MGNWLHKNVLLWRSRLAWRINAIRASLSRSRSHTCSEKRACIPDSRCLRHLASLIIPRLTNVCIEVLGKFSAQFHWRKNFTRLARRIRRLHAFSCAYQLQICLLNSAASSDINDLNRLEPFLIQLSDKQTHPSRKRYQY